MPSGGKGLADFSNNRFFSAGTNLGHNQYGSPPNAPTAYTLTSVPATHWDGQPATWTSAFGSGTAPVRLYNYRVEDNLNPNFSVAQVPLTSASVFDEFLRRAQFLETFHLSHENYDAQADLLIPRAVAYSAGLLEYFFRGSMQISLPSAGIYGIVDHAAFSNTDARAGFKGFGKVKLKLRNTTPNSPGTTTPEALSNGSLFAVLKFRRNTCYLDSLDGEIVQIAQATACRSTVEEAVVSDPINNVSVPAATTSAPNGIEYTFFFPKQLPINAWDVVLQVVYRGRLGNEDDAVVVTTKDISEPTFITIRNDTDYVSIGSRCYKPEAIAANDALWNALAASCRDGSGATRKVAATCINVPFNLRYSFGTAFPPVGVAWENSGLVDRRMRPRRFGRVAILEEDTAPTNWALAFNNAPYTLVPGGGSALAVDPYSVQSDASRSVADVHVVSRGLRLWEGVGVMVDGATAAVGVGCTGVPLDGLAGAERIPAPAAIIGW